MKLKLNIKRVSLCVILIALTVLAYAYFIEPNTIRNESLDIDLGCADSTGNGFKFVQISDLHYTKDTEERKISELSGRIEENNPSAVFITGDLISDKNGIEKAVELVRSISNNFPTFVVFGNWDYWSLDFDLTAFTSKLDQAGAKVITNKNSKIYINGKDLYVLGVKDPYTSGENEEDVKKALEGIGPDDKSCKILLAHSPNVIKYAKNKGIDLILVGHTHGGQVYIPYLSEYFIPARREGGKGFISGLYEIDNEKMYVNRGIGMSVLPLRFLVPPEMTIISIN